jgi:hypothetical protein
VCGLPLSGQGGNWTATLPVGVRGVRGKKNGLFNFKKVQKIKLISQTWKQGLLVDICIKNSESLNISKITPDFRGFRGQ